MSRIVTITMNPSIDTSCRAEQVVAERKLRCLHTGQEPGGGGINISRAICRLGGTSLAMFPAGRIFGTLLRELLDGEGVEYRHIPIQGETRENFSVLEQSTNRQYRFGMQGPRLYSKEWKGLLDQLDDVNPAPEYIVASGSLPPGVPDTFYARLARKASSMNAKFIVDTSGQALKLALQSPLFLIKPNVRELGSITGEDIPDDEGQEESARRLVHTGNCKAVVVSRGAGGVLLVTAEETIRFNAPSVRVVSKVGAGDSMVAGIILALSRENSLIEAVKFGVACGTAAVMTPGSELCRKEDVERLAPRITVQS